MHSEAIETTLIESLAEFEEISLNEMDNVKLMNRVDVKYLVPINQLTQLLGEAIPYYRILSVEEKHIFEYQTLYFDTEEFNLYRDHLTGRFNRYKIRLRNYVDSNQSFFEIKLKNHKGRTIKTRIKQEMGDMNWSKQKIHFLENNSPLKAETLKPQIWVNYKRITLVNKSDSERLTIDIDLNFLKGCNKSIFDSFSIFEIKQDKKSVSPIINILKERRLRPWSMSKYCLGLIEMTPNLKKNRFKPSLIQLNKLKKTYEPTSICE
jgi:SPX domain protein involved in polyphosphate accumulation